jgi:hypothetical protein
LATVAVAAAAAAAALEPSWARETGQTPQVQPVLGQVG